MENERIYGEKRKLKEKKVVEELQINNVNVNFHTRAAWNGKRLKIHCRHLFEEKIESIGKKELAESWGSDFTLCTRLSEAQWTDV